MPVFETSDQALLPLATLALEGERVAYVVRRPPSLAPAMTSRSDMPFIDAGVVARILVRPEDVSRARDLLADLQQASREQALGFAGSLAPAVASDADGEDAPEVLEPEVVRMIELRDPRSVLSLGQITSIEARFLVDALEGEDSVQARYFIEASTIEMLEAAGADRELVETLRRALGSQEGVEIQFSLRDVTA